MNPDKLQVGDYVEIFFPAENRTQLAEVKALDRDNNKAELLPQNARNGITVSTPEQWQLIKPHSIFCQDLHAFGFNETSLDIAYGWTAKEWIKISQTRKYVFHISYDETSWRLEIIWIAGMMQRTEVIEGILYIHELQHTLIQYNKTNLIKQ